MKVSFQKSIPIFIIIIFVMTAFLISAGPARVPSAQTVATDQGDFPLYTVLTEKNQASVSDTCYVSVAVYPAVADPGSFTIDGSPLAVTGDMTYGAVPSWNPGDLLKYFTQLEFAFEPLQKTGTYNSADNPEGPMSGEGGYWYAFNFEDTSFAGPGNPHFDLYNAKFAKYASNDIVGTDLFAPPSDDTQKVPEPSTVLLLGAGLFGLAGFRRKFKV